MTFDWSALGLTAAKVKTITAPAIPNFQPAMSWAVGEDGGWRVPVEPAKGWLLVIKEQ